MKIKTKPTERRELRYLLIDGDFSSFEKAIISFIGTLGLSEMAPLKVDIKDDKMKLGQIVIAINRKKLDHARAAVELSKDKIKILRVSGTLKGLF